MIVVNRILNKNFPGRSFHALGRKLRSIEQPPTVVVPLESLR
jgi:hypothetical protein